MAANFVVKEKDDYYIVGDEASAIQISIKKRSAYPGTYCYTNNDGVVFGYGPDTTSSDAGDEYLRIAVGFDGTIHITRDALATLPIYWGEADYVFALSNRYHFVCTSLPRLSHSIEGVLDALLLHTNLTTIWNQVHVLGPHETLHYEESKPTIAQLPFRSSSLSQDAPSSDPYAFGALFSTHLDSFIDKFANQKTGFIISGGLDSATLPFYLAARRKIRPHSPATTLLYPGELGKRQNIKLQAAEQYTGLAIHRISLDAIAKLAPDTLSADENHHVHFWQDPYTIYAKQQMIEYLKGEGVEVVFGGHGGDDIMENIVKDARELGYSEQVRDDQLQGLYNPYITPKAIADLTQSITKNAAALQPLPLPVSAYTYAIRVNTMFIENDIWPVSPYNNPYLYAFCQGLPVYFRSNKNILRLFHKAYGFPTEIYAADQEEHFGDFYKAALTSDLHKNLLHKYAQTSTTAEFGYVDIEKLLSSYYDSMDRSPEDNELAIPIASLFWIGLEIDAHLGKKHRQS